MTTRLRLLLVLVPLLVHAGCNAKPLDRERKRQNVRPYAQWRAGRTVLSDARAAGVELESPTAEASGGFGLGADFGPRWSAEVAIDTVETAMNDPSTGLRLGEISRWTFLAQARIRRPMCSGRLVPYALAGAGFGLASHNDRVLNAPIDVSGSAVVPVGSVGAGLDWFLDDHVAIGLQARYLYGFGDDFEFKFDGQRRTLSLDGLDLQAAITVYADRVSKGLLCPERVCLEPSPRDNGCFRLYLQGRAGLTGYLSPGSVDGLTLDSPSEAFGASLGANLNRYLGIEIAGEYAETGIKADGLGPGGEYALWTVTGLLRLRYPLMRGRLVPYVLGGAGLGWGETNDVKPAGQVAAYDGGQESRLIGTVGLGIEYFVDDSITVGLDAKHAFPFERRIRLDGRIAELDLAPLFVTLGMRVYIP